MNWQPHPKEVILMHHAAVGQCLHKSASQRRLSTIGDPETGEGCGWKRGIEKCEMPESMQSPNPVLLDFRKNSSG